ncbi:MAG: hypothetical protein K0Q50_1266 [Vampirovibrio sp.]|jgi:hypothetical protein|nr:hypothetical protein [Vampirovibrio sp.]
MQQSPAKWNGGAFINQCFFERHISHTVLTAPAKPIFTYIAFINLGGIMLGAAMTAIDRLRLNIM